MDKFTSVLVFVCVSFLMISCTGGDTSTTSNNPPGSSTTGSIGPAGGIVNGYYGANITIPAGALASSVDIVITPDSTGAPDIPVTDVDTAGATYALTPHGTAFTIPATVKIPFDADRIPTDATPVLYKAEPGGSFSAIPTSVDNNMLTADVDNFSWVIPGYASTRPRMVYALTDGGTKVSSFKITKITGALSAATSSALVGASPISISVHPSRRFAYVTNAGSTTVNNIAPNSVSVYQLNPVTGSISGPTDTKQANGHPISAVVHPTGKFVYVVNEVRFGSPIGNISVFSVNPTTGALSAPTTTADSGGAPATALAFSPSGDYAYVTYMWASGAPSTYYYTVKTFTVDSTTGVLSAPIGSVATGDTPWAIAVTPDGHYAYVAINSSSQSEVRIYAIDQSTGVLTYQSSVALPSAKPSSLAMDSEGRFLYVGEQQPISSKNLLVFSINSANGSLANAWSELTGTGSLVGPISVVAEPQGEFVYAMDVTGEIVQYSLNAGTGELTSAGSAVTGAYVGGGTTSPGDPFFFAASGTSPVWVNGCTLGCAIYGGGGGGGGGGSTPPPAATHYLNITIVQGGGTVVSSPSGINYSTIAAELAKNASGAGFPTGTTVQLCMTHTDNLQTYDVKWTGSGGCGGTSSCTSLYMNHDQYCTLTLTPTSNR